MRKITKNTTLGAVLEIKGAEKVLKKHGVPCVTCPFAKIEMDTLKLDYICKTYNLNLVALLKDLNSLI